MRISFYEFLQRLRFSSLFAITIILTLTFALVYYWTDSNFKDNGIVSTRANYVIQPTDYIYFSVGVTTTFGTVDLAPIGYAKAIVSLQAFLSVILAGILVAKITSVSINRFNDIEQAIVGTWVDIVKLEDGKYWLGIVEFITDDGDIMFRGDNYDMSGKQQHDFSCKLLYHDWPGYLVFRYDESHAPGFFTKGETTVAFSNWYKRKPQCFSVTIQDKQFNKNCKVRGWRASKEDLKLIKNKKPKPEFIKQLIQKYQALCPE